MASDNEAGKHTLQTSLGTIFLMLVTGIVIGTALSWVLLFEAVDVSAPWINSTFHFLMVALGLGAVALVIIVPATLWAIRKFIGTARGSLNQIVVEIGAAARAQDQANFPTVVHHVERAALEALAWYTPRAARRWVVQTSFALLLALGGLAGTALIFRQTLLLGEQNKILGKQDEKLKTQIGLLKEQNEKLDLQTITAETSQRRAMLAPELFSLLQIIASNPKKPLDDGVSSRMVAFTQAAAPYSSLEVIDENGQRTVRLSKRPRSAERGQLLAALVANSVTIPPQSNFDAADLRGSTFDDAQMQGKSLLQADFAQARMEKADFEFCRLSGANFTNVFGQHASFRYAYMEKTDLSGAHMNNASFIYAKMNEALLIETTIRGADFEGADLSGAKFNGAEQDPRISNTFGLPSLSMRFANLIGADFTGARLLEDVDWRGAIVGKPKTDGLPDGFPKGWSGPPNGWKLVEADGLVRLEKIEAPPKKRAR